MLVMSPNFAKALRKAARREQEKLRGSLGRGPFDAIKAEIVAVLRLALAAGVVVTPLGLEGPLRAALRRDFCLQGYRWRDAHDLACLLLAESFTTLRVERPSWSEGQPEWIISAGDLIERTRCVRCHKPLPEGHRKFCGDPCAKGHHARLHRLREATEDTAVQIAIKTD